MSIEEIVGIQNRFKLFMDGVRVVMLIDRGVMNSNKGSKRWINKIITTNQNEWINAVNVLLGLQKHVGNPDIRLYSCLNDRKLDKSIAMFKHKQIDLLDDMKHRFYSKINDSFASCLMKPENKLSKYFMLDIDSKDTKEADKFISDNLLQVVHTYPTKNGWHYILEPFNVMLAKGKKTFSVNKDAMLLIKFLEDKND